MKITKIKTVGFRKFDTEFKTNLYDITNITGGNTKGKTNILFAIVWAFLGSNITGDEKVWLGNKNSEDCMVELEFIDNQGNLHHLVRYKNKYDNKKNFLMLDEKQAENCDLVSFYSDKKLFLSIINPTYFVNKKPAEQKQLIEKYLPRIDINTVYDRLEDSEKKYLEQAPMNIKLFIQDLNSDKKNSENKIKNLKGQIEYAKNVADEDIDPKKTFEKSKELELAEQELDFLVKEQNKHDKIAQQHIVNHLEKELEKYEQELQSLQTEMKSGKTKYLSIKKEANPKCPMCNQEMQDKSKQATINHMKNDLVLMFEKENRLKNNISDLKSKIMVEKCQLHTFDNLDIGKDQIETRIKVVKAQLQALKDEQMQIEKYNSQIDAKQKAKQNAIKDIKGFKLQIENEQNLIDNIQKTKKIAEKLFINYIEEKMKYATKYLKNVGIKYYSVLKESGELKEDFIITYKGNEYKYLSKSETMLASIELRYMFNKISKVNIPLFIDDTESCVDYNFTQDFSRNTQMLIARVEKGEELCIYDYNNEALKQVA